MKRSTEDENSELFDGAVAKAAGQLRSKPKPETLEEEVREIVIQFLAALGDDVQITARAPAVGERVEIQLKPLQEERHGLPDR